MAEMKLRPGIRFTGSKDGEKYQIVTLAKERISGEKMIVYQQLFEPFTVYTESAKVFFNRMKKSSQDKNVSQQNRETSRETISDRETNRETFSDSETSRETNRETMKKEAEEPEIHPEFRRFLDAESNTERIEILRGMRNIVDDTMINSMAVIMDVEIKDGPIGERFDELLECMQMKRQYEIERY